MSRRLLGETFDIHGGGLDLVFPHHENEIAQSESRHGKPMAKYWMHNGLMQASSEVGKVGGRHTRAAEGDIQSQDAGKISKSAGRARSASCWPSSRRRRSASSSSRPTTAGRSTSARSGSARCETGLDTFYRFFKRYERIAGKELLRDRGAAEAVRGRFPARRRRAPGGRGRHRQRFLEAMDDDFNTGGAIGILFDLLRRLNKFADDEKLEEGKPPQAKLAALEQGARTLRELAATLGLFRRPPQQTKPAAGEDALVARLMDLLIEVRADARKSKNFAAADKIRNAAGGAGRAAGGSARRDGVGEERMKDEG